MKIKTLFLSLLFSLCFLKLDAQIREKLNIGAGLDFGSEVSEGGLDIRIGYFVIKQLNVVIDINNFFVKDEVFVSDTYWNEYNLNAHYYFDYRFRDRLLAIYGLAGVNASTLGFQYDDHPLFNNEESSDFYIGLNLGAGVDFNLSKNFKPFIETKYLLVEEISQLEIGFGMKYVF